MPKMICVLAPFILFGSTAALGQTQAIITDTRIITESDGGQPDTVIVHALSSGNRYRVEFVGGKNPLNPFGAAGSTQLITISDGDLTITFLDPAAKTYFEFKPFGLLNGVQEMMKALGAEMNLPPGGDSTVLDSLGDGGVIAGYRTLHFRHHSSYGMSMNLMGESFTTSITDSTDTYVAPALKADMSRDSAYSKMRPLEEVMNTLSGGMAAGMFQMVARGEGARKRISAAGVPVRTISVVTTVLGGNPSRHRQVTELLKFERAAVADSVFAVPAGYKKEEPMLRMRTTPDSGLKTSRSPRKPF